ncbi:MAG TPA: ABC transporter substrate binding protein [Ideonella sp.]|uniref:ABC transporter substrate binding protein n=1 Tax=Ideonella sp. TaxID=1929293 RepID=UPI002B8A12A4|nr:ABC transporter substrate binding protein [Ideonella sp.]HSI51559.1 ABC transporter substrate binding protein [Ideonella sp.]
MSAALFIALAVGLFDPCPASATEVLNNDERTTPTIAILGSAAAGKEDPSYQRFAKAWLARSSGCSSHHLAYLSGPEIQAQLDADFSRQLRQLSSDPRSIFVAPTAAFAESALPLLGPASLVFATYADPVAHGLLEPSGARHRHVTGVSLNDQLSLLRLTLLMEAFPRIKAIGVVADDSWAGEQFKELETAFRKQHPKVRLELLTANKASDLDAVFRKAASPSIGALYYPPSAIAYFEEATLIARTVALRKPAMHSTQGEVQRGALMAYSQDTSFVFDALADLVLRICRGEPAETIPVERPRRFVLSIRAQYDLGGAKIAPAVVSRADLVVP